MSRAAEEYVKACTHPKVKGGTRALFDAIAHFVPEGQTTTPVMTLKELAARARHTERTAQTCRDLLEAIGVIKVHEGGRGKLARYEVVDLAGERPIIAAPLPLLGRPRPPRTKEPRSSSDLFSDLDEPRSEISSDLPTARAYTVRNFFRSCGQQIGNFFRSVLFLLQKIGNFFRSQWSRTIKERSRSEISSDLAPASDAVLTTARDVHTFKNVHTHTAPRAGPTDDEMASWSAAKVLTPEESAAYDAWLARGGTPAFANPTPRVMHPWHAWCGPVCVPKHLHDAWLDKGHGATWLFAFYARTCAALTAEDARRVVDEFKFWRTALQAELAPDAPNIRAPNSVASRRPDIPISRPCPHQPPCAEGDTDACVERSMAHWRLEQTRKSG